MSLYGFEISNQSSSDNILVKIYHNNFYRNISLGYIITSSYLELNNENQAFVCISYSENQIIITKSKKTTTYNISNSFKINNKTIKFINDLLNRDFGIFIRDYIGNINKKELTNYIDSIQNTCK